MQIGRLIYIILFSVLASSGFAETQTRLLPSDEAHRDLSLVEFREKLLTAIEHKEPESLVTMIDQQVWIGHGSKRGMRAFLALWEPQSIDSELWETLGEILKMGGNFIRSNRGVKFCAPYIYSSFPDELDIYGHGAIISDDVPLKPKPNISARNLTSLSYDLVKVHDWRSVADSGGVPSRRWIKVTTLSGLEGYVDKKYVRSPTDYAACFLNRTGVGWKLISLLNNE